MRLVLCILVLSLLKLSYAKILKRGALFVDNFFNTVLDELKYRKSSFDQYRIDILSRFEKSFEEFREGQKAANTDASKEVAENVKRLAKVYESSVSALKRQLEEIDILSRAASASRPRPKRMDESLEQFQKLYNDSLANIPSIWRNPFSILQPFSLKVERFHHQFQQQLGNTLLSLASVENKGILQLDELKLNLELTKIQEDIVTNARQIVESSQQSIQNAIDKGSIRKEQLQLEKQLALLEKQRKEWILLKSSQMESALKSIQERVSGVGGSRSLINKNNAVAYYVSLTDTTLSKVLRYIDSADPDWNLIKSADGVKVYRKMFRADSKYAMVKATGIINASPAKLNSLLQDNTRVKEYNDYFDRGVDLEEVAPGTKIVWATAQRIFPFKQRDFCTIVHFRTMKDGTIVVLNRAVEHPKAPTSPHYVRASIVLAANIIQPIPYEPNKCKLTMLTQLDPGGFAPPVLVNQICTLGPVSFYKKISDAVKRTPHHRKPVASFSGTQQLHQP